MPQVPKYEPGQITPKPLPGPRFFAGTTAESFGGVQARELGQLGQALEQVAATAAKYTLASAGKKDAGLARTAYNNARREWQEWFKTDLNTREAEAALDAHVDAGKKLEEINRKHGVGLKTTRQKELFKASYDGFTVGALNQALGVQEQQREKLKQVSMTVEKKVATDAAVEGRNDRHIIAESEFTVGANTLEEFKDYPKKVRDKAVADNISTMYDTVLMAVTQDSPGAGLSFLINYWDKFNPTFAADRKDALEKLAGSELVWKLAKDLSGSGMLLKEQLAEVDKMSFGDPGDLMTAKDAVTLRSQLRERDMLKRHIAKAEAQRALDAEWDKVLKAGKDAVIPNHIDPAEQKKMQEYKDKSIDEWANNLTVGPARTTTPEGWSWFNSYMSMEPEELAKQDIFKHINIMALPQFNKLMTQWRSSRSNADGVKNEVIRTRTPHQHFKSMIAGMSYFDPNVKSQPGRNVSAEHIRKRDGWFHAQVDEHRNKTLVPEEEQTTKWLDELGADLLSDVAVSRGFGRAKLKVKKFEISYLSDVGFAEEEVKAALAERPKKLKEFDDLQYDATENKYFRDIRGGTERDVFDRLTGEYIVTIPITDKTAAEEWITIKVGG